MVRMKIAAFNVKKLSWTKVNKPHVRNILIKGSAAAAAVMTHWRKVGVTVNIIVSQYSVVVLLEVVDQSGKAMDKLLRELNKTRNRQHRYDMMCSEPLGRRSYREKFVFFYRQDEVNNIESFQYKEREDNEDVLAREPFVLWFSCPNAAVQKLALIPVHTRPVDAERELDALGDVVEAVRKRWRTDEIMILGDFNADGRYLSKRKKAKISLCSAPYHWLIDDDVDTTTSNSTDHTYDRIVVFGENMYNAVVPHSAQAFNFQRAYELSEADAEAISDHYPVEVELKEN